MKVLIFLYLFFSISLQANICNSRGKCFGSTTIKKMNELFCKSIGKGRIELQKIFESANNSDSFNLKENYDLVNCYKRSNPQNLSKTIIMRDMWPGYLTAHLCYASRDTNLKDFKWVRDGVKRRPHWRNPLKTYKFVLKNGNDFRKFCNGVYPFNGNFRLRNRVLKSN